MLKKIALLVVMFALPLGVMAQAKFAHMNSQEVIAVMPEFTKAQADLDAMSKKYQDEMQRTNEEFQKKYQEFLAQADSLPKTLQKDARKSCRIWLNVKNSSSKKLIKACRKHSKMPWLPSIRNWTKPFRLWAKLKALSTFSTWLVPRYLSLEHRASM